MAGRQQIRRVRENVGDVGEFAEQALIVRLLGVVTCSVRYRADCGRAVFAVVRGPEMLYNRYLAAFAVSVPDPLSHDD